MRGFPFINFLFLKKDTGNRRWIVNVFLFSIFKFAHFDLKKGTYLVPFHFLIKQKSQKALISLTF